MYNLWNSSLCNFLQSPATSSILSPNIPLSTLFSNTVSLYSFLGPGDQTSHSIKKWVTLIFTILGRKSRDSSVGVAVGYELDDRGSIPGRARNVSLFHSVQTGSRAQLRSYLEEKVAAPVWKTEINDRGNPLRWPRYTLYPQKLPLLRQQATVVLSA
jgi:hypothetical protein